VAPKLASQRPDFIGEFEPKNLSQKTNLHFEKVNDVTLKLTNGEATNVPASHGQWAGYRKTKAVVWVIKIGSNAWLARCGDQVCGPSCFNEAKANALAMAKGDDCDYILANPIAHLNGLQAQLEDRQDNEPSAAANGSSSIRSED